MKIIRITFVDIIFFVDICTLKTLYKIKNLSVNS